MAKRHSRTQAINPHDSDPRDRCYTPAYALDPLLPYLHGKGTLWESACGAGHLVTALESAGHRVIASELQHGQNFFTWQPLTPWDVQVTNPPYSSKYHWIARSYDLGKPFALLMPLETLGAKSAQRFFSRHGMELLVLDKRVNFYMPNMGLAGSGASFPVAWFCWQLLPSPMVYGTFHRRADTQAVMAL